MLPLDATVVSHTARGAQAMGRSSDARRLAKRRQAQAVGLSLAAFGALVALVTTHPVGSATGTTVSPPNSRPGEAGVSPNLDQIDGGNRPPVSSLPGLGLAPSNPRLRVGSGIPHLWTGGS